MQPDYSQPPMVRDFTGVRVRCGDTIVYAVSKSSNIALNLARVAELTWSQSRWEGDTQERQPRVVAEWLQGSFASSGRVKGEQVTLSAMSNFVVVSNGPTPESHPEWEACRRG